MSNNTGAGKGKKTVCFPFEFISMNDKKCSFIRNVEGILDSDLQADKSFGCKIKNCHTHAGSKVHFRDFIEAEILFHNNYYNHGFAFLTVEEVVRRIKRIHDNNPAARISKVYLIGYESYSELYLKEVKRQLTEYQSENIQNISCDYFIYETLSLDESRYDRPADGEKKKDCEICAKEKHTSGTESIQPVRKYGIKPAANIRNLEFDDKDGRILYCSYGLKDKSEKTRLTFTEDTSDCLFVYVVPINTTLSTMDKMAALFENRCWGENLPTPLYRLLISLITIGPKPSVDNLYWDKQTESNPYCREILVPKEERFGKLIAEDKVVNFAFTESTWTYAKGSDLKGRGAKSATKNICKDCYPDINGKKLIEESPIFDVNRSSVVPMLQLGQNLPLKPINMGKADWRNLAAGEDAVGTEEDAIDFEAAHINLKRIWRMAEYTTHHHICRGSNHFQYYLDTPGFLNAYTDAPSEPDVSVSNYLKEIRKQSKPDTNDECVIYNFIVAPSHKTNAEWVNLVYYNVFSYNGDDFNKSLNGARMLYFDISKEYRSNFKAKYSDLLQSFSNILSNDRAFEIRFHYVDETITTGSRFLRAADLIQSLLSAVSITEEQKKRIKLFHSVYLLYGRSSGDSKAFYYRLFKESGLKDFQEQMKENFHEYAAIRISNLRNFKDACTLCKLTKDYRLIRSYCATNTLAENCTNVINAHQPVKATILSKSDQFKSNLEKKYMFLITHILNLRIRANNVPVFDNEQIKRQIAVESENAAQDIKLILENYYSKLPKWLMAILGDSFQNSFAENTFNKAFIKTISRPFFTFHLRKRQASFAFCLEQLDKLSKGENQRNHELIETLEKALADMNANYLIRQEPYLRLSSIAENATDSVGSTLRFCAAIKKNITLSQDTAKSLLLEHVLVNRSEAGFFGVKASDAELPENPENYFIKSQTVKGQSEKVEVLYLPGMATVPNRTVEVKALSLDGLMYLENNRILVEALSDIYRNPSLTSQEKASPYYLDNFKYLCRINRVYLSNNFGSHYQSLLDNILKNKLPCHDLNESVNAILASLPNKCDALRIVPFIRNKRISKDRRNYNKLFEFMLFSGDDVDQKQFYRDDNRQMLHDGFAYLMEGNSDQAKKMICRDVLFLGNKTVVVRFLQNEHSSLEDSQSLLFDASSDVDNALYFEISNFDESSVVHWFRLKVILSLRNAISEMIASINLPVVIEKQLNEMLQSAVTDSSAMTHADLEQTMNLMFFDQNDSGDYENCGIKKGLELAAQEDQAKLFMQRVYYRYLSLTSDELLASWYRKIIRREKDSASLGNAVPRMKATFPFYYKSRFSQSEQDSFVYWMERLFNTNFEQHGFEKTEGGFLAGCFRYYCRDGIKFKEVNVNLIIDSAKDKLSLEDCRFSILSFALNGARNFRYILYPIIVLLVNNAVSHADAKTVDIIFHKKDITIENITNETEKDLLREKLKDGMSMLPFLMQKDRFGYTSKGKHEGLTLWTLKHLNNDHDWLSAEYKGTRFVVTLKNSIKENRSNEKNCQNSFDR